MSNPGYGSSGYGLGGYGNEPIETLPIGYYQNLLTSQYRSASPKLRAFLYLLLKKFDDVSQCMVQMDTAFDLDFAVGPQLDLLGQIVGAARTVGFQPSDGVSPVLDDDAYRILIKARIGWNQWDGTIDSLYTLWQQLFPGGTIVILDNQNMTATISLTGTFTSITQDLITNGYIIPRPEGVLYTYEFGTLPYFGFGSSSTIVASTTATFTSGATSITVASAINVAVGQTVQCTGVPVGTTVTSVSGTTVGLSASTTSAEIATVVLFVFEYIAGFGVGHWA